MKIALVSLRQLFENGVASDTIQQALNHFQCSRDNDVKHFLESYALNNEAIGASRSYLAINQDALENEEQLVIVAFFTLAVAVTDYSGISNRLKRRIMGDYPRIAKESHFPGFLLGQLARDDRYSKTDFDCRNLLGIAEEIVNKAACMIGGNILYLDCKEALVEYYENLGYSILKDANDEGFYKMFKCLPRFDPK